MKVHKKETLAYISTDRMTGKQLHFVIGTHQKKKVTICFKVSSLVWKISLKF